VANRWSTYSAQVENPLSGMLGEVFWIWDVFEVGTFALYTMKYLEDGTQV
jgi:hypothetical protein